MKNEFHRRLYEMEVSPPKQVWNFISIELDEINKDILIAGKLQETVFHPPIRVWENIKGALETKEEPNYKKKGLIISWRRLAVAAIFIGVIISVWILFFIPQKGNNEIVNTVNTSPSIQDDKIVPFNPQLNKPANKTENIPQPNSSFLVSGKMASVNKKNTRSDKQTAFSSLETDVSSITIKNDKPGDKVFNQPIDDLTMIAPTDEYMTMVTTNGRIVKIPSQFVHLAPLLQNKPVTEDFYELMFGEAAFWKEKMSEWRQLLATVPISSGDMFSNMLELMKTVDERSTEGK